ncbi:MAG: carbon monoxide dehydrogenase [bacterium]|nr:carbon monoxide dehydrogenase [bacterium]
MGDNFTIAIAGKGGTGKTTFAGLVIRYLIKNNLIPILAVDADANANLNEVLGVKVIKDIGSLREETIEGSKNLPAGMPKETYIELRLQEAIVEASGFDLIVMGRPEGPGCYCYANQLFRKYIDILTDSYRFTLMDNEAGMEHLSRRTTKDVDVLFIVSDPSMRGLRSAVRIRNLVDELKLSIKEMRLIINRADEEVVKNFETFIRENRLELAGVIPNDDLIFEYDLYGKPIFDLHKESKAVIAVESIVERNIKLLISQS